MSIAFPELRHPIVQAPLAGGPSTPELAAAVSNAGGLGFLAAGYLTAQTLDAQIDRLRSLSDQPFGVNIFCLSETAIDAAALERYARRIEPYAGRHGAELGEPRFEDDGFDAKLELVIERGIRIVSFTFGSPPQAVIERLHAAGTAAWVTVTDGSEAELAAAAGADALVAQGVEAGGHRGSFSDEDGSGELSLLVLLRLLARLTELPLVAAGGIADGAGVAAALAAGAVAAQIGTAFMRCPEAGTSPAHRRALAAPGRTELTRAFTGRRARGIVNEFMAQHGAHAPAAYPHVHHLTSPLRRAARTQGDAEAINLWAGEAHALTQEAPAGELVSRWAADAGVALALAQGRLGPADSRS